MRHFICDACAQPVYFENTVCLSCGRGLGYLPDLDALSTLEPAADGNGWTALAPDRAGQRYRSCQNQLAAQACNWMIAQHDPQPFCASCRLNDVIPDLSWTENLQRWRDLEAAKRRLLYSLSILGLPVTGKQHDPQHGLSFAFLSSDALGPDDPPVVTGHAQGRITIDIAEADGAHRERQRLNMNELYRTLLGHLRHEIGHYYWDVLIDRGGRHEEFRRLFGDERVDYADALQRYYAGGAPGDWQSRHISAYASSHAWEDWAETWAHYLHIADTLETASAVGLNVSAAPTGAPAPGWGTDEDGQPTSFQRLMRSWPALTFAVNSLNRSMGLPDLYPFVIAEPVAQKLRFIHDVIRHGGRDATVS